MSTSPQNIGVSEALRAAPQMYEQNQASSERLDHTHIELPAPSLAQRELFLDILRSDTPEAPDRRFIPTQIAHNFLLDQLNEATLIRDRIRGHSDMSYADLVAAYNNGEVASTGIYSKYTDAEVRDAYVKGADAYAGMLALAPDLITDDAMEQFEEWAMLAATATRRIESTHKSRYSVAITPATLARDEDQKDSVRQSIADVERNERVFAYEQAARVGDTNAIREAFTGVNASPVTRAQALFEYAHNSIPSDQTQLKVDCLSEVVAVLKDAVENGTRPRDDDAVGIYNYFMLQSILGRAVHDIVWLDDQGTDDDIKARRLSIEYLTNTRNALEFVRHNAITSHEASEDRLREDKLGLNEIIVNDEKLRAADDTIDFLSQGLQPLENQVHRLAGITTDPWKYVDEEGDREPVQSIQESIATLKAKAEKERLEEKIAEEQAKYSQRFNQIRAEHADIFDRSMALRSEAIGFITPGSKGHDLAGLVLDIDKQLKDVSYFIGLYEGEYRQPRDERFASIMEAKRRSGRMVLRVLEMVNAISPEREELSAPLLLPTAA